MHHVLYQLFCHGIDDIYTPILTTENITYILHISRRTLIEVDATNKYYKNSLFS